MRTINISGQSFEKIRTNNYFYIDKTSFIKEWWENRDTVTLITRPRRFGKTLNMDMLNCFFSMDYAGRSDLFEGLDIWKDEEYRELQGTYPVISLNFADIKTNTYTDARLGIIRVIQNAFQSYKDKWTDDTEEEKQRYAFMNISESSDDVDISFSLERFSKYLFRRYKKKVLIFLDEYDTLIHGAYTNGYWNEISGLLRTLFVSTFKTNTSLERALMTGVIRLSNDFIFSDMNNVLIITTTSNMYETSFGFTQEEVNAALDEYHLSDQKEMVEKWYGGFTFGKIKNIYNPRSITNFLYNCGKYCPYRADTSSNALISCKLQMAANDIKSQIEDLLSGGTIETRINEQIIFSHINTDSETMWSFLLATGYLKVVSRSFNGIRYSYVLKITNFEVELTLQKLIAGWFETAGTHYSSFIKSLITGNSDEAQRNLKNILLSTASFYDPGIYIHENDKPASFYHGLVLGMVAQENEYHITSNRESGLGRYDVMLKPLKKDLPGIIIEFKLFDPKREKTLDETAERALLQIFEKKYDTELIDEGIPSDKILHYGMAFSGKQVIVKLG